MRWLAAPTLQQLPLSQEYVHQMLIQAILFLPSLLWALLSDATVLVDFQVAQPPPVPSDTKACTIQILQ